jgi:hypothetical protein
VQLTSQQFTNNAKEVEEEDLKAYLASSSDEEGDILYNTCIKWLSFTVLIEIMRLLYIAEYNAEFYWNVYTVH